MPIIQELTQHSSICLALNQCMMEVYLRQYTRVARLQIWVCHLDFSWTFVCKKLTIKTN